MSWQAAVLFLLAAILLAGVAWYERSRPRTQVIALVAALAALAVAGRIVFSPIPNVVPTTDIALISGYALGGPPGFAVGGLAALVSNFWLGQGPWTPWQMGGWGLAGVLGAGLAVVRGCPAGEAEGQPASRCRGIGRLALATACGAAGLAYGALLDLSLMVSYGGEQSLERFLALSARGLPFNLAHAAGNFAIALVAGPALVRMLVRYRRRFEFAWPGQRGRRPERGLAAGAACALAALCAAAAIPAGAGAPDPAAAAPGARAAASGPGGAVGWLRAAQNEDGGFASERGGDSSPEMTGWAMLGLEAAGVHPAALRRGGTDPIGYLRKTAGQIRTTGDLQRTILALAAARVSPRSFAGRDLVRRLLNRRGDDGSWEGQVNTTAFGVLALKAVGRRVGGASVGWLRDAANPDGGWGFAPGAPSDPDSTGAALQALGAAGGSLGTIRAGVAWLRGAQHRNGGFALLGGPVNAQSTAWAAQGLIAAGVAPRKVRSGGRSPLDYLASVQAGDGHYRYSASLDQTPVWVTAQAMQAAAGQALPLRPLRPPKRRAQKRAPVPAVPAPTPTPRPPAAKPGGGGSAAPGKPAPAPPAESPVPELPVEPPSASAAAEDDREDSPLPELGSAAAALLVALGGAWMLRRQGV